MHPRIKLERLTTPICDRAEPPGNTKKLGHGLVTPDIIPVHFLLPSSMGQIRAQVEPDESPLQWISASKQPVKTMGVAATKEATRWWVDAVQFDRVPRQPRSTWPLLLTACSWLSWFYLLSLHSVWFILVYFGLFFVSFRRGGCTSIVQ